MPDFQEQLADINRLRADSRAREEEVYGARIALSKARQRTSRSGQARPAPERDAEIAQLRGQMAQLDVQLAALRDEEREVTRQLEEIAAQKRGVEQLTQALAILREREAALRQQLLELRQQVPQPQTELEWLTGELEDLERSRAELEAALRSAVRAADAVGRRERDLRQRQQELRGRIDGLRADLRGLQDRIAELSRPTLDDPAAAKSDVERLERLVRARRDDELRVNRELSRAIDHLYRAEDPHPRHALALLDDQWPFLLFPVRIETIFATATTHDGATGTELRVRVFPDEILVHTHESTLTDSEVDAGKLYWTELVVAAHLRTRRAERQQDAWRHIVDLFGGQRASWIARNTRPTDWPSLSADGEARSLIEFLQGADAGFFAGLLALPLSSLTRSALNQAIAQRDGDALMTLAQQQSWGERINTVARTQIAEFPAIDLTRTDAWSRAPRTRVLPDRFVLLYRSADAAPQEHVGALISDSVFLGPDPLVPGETLVTQDHALTLGGKCEWMTNFNTALEQGLGFRVPLTEQEADEGFARIVVLGLRLSAGPEQGAAMLEELIGNHQFSAKGFSLVGQGTPTNNTERDGSGYSDNDAYDDLAFFSEVEPPAFNPDDSQPRRSQTDGRLLADALGISYAALQSVPSADQTDVLEARAMNIALFPATLGYWLNKWMSPVITPEVARFTRTFFTRQVTGRGPLPAIRVGNQPYGILVTSDLSRWKYGTPQGIAGVELFGDRTPHYRGLLKLLQQLDRRWTTLSADVAHVGRPGSDSSNMLMQMLGLHPTSVEFYQRIGFHETYLRDLPSFIKPGTSFANELASLLISMPPTVRLYLRDLGFEEDIPTVARMLALHVLWQHYTGPIDVPNLVEARPASEKQSLASNYIDWLVKAENVAKIVDENFSGASPPAALLYLMLRNALLLQLHHGSYEWLARRAEFEPALTSALKDHAVIGVRAGAPSIAKVQLMALPADAVKPDHPVPGMSVADWIWSGPTPAEAEAAYVKLQREALAALTTVSTAGLERCLVEHLDCCNYRLDAWETGLFAQRLESQRGGAANGEGRRRGVYLGAFGWVEQVKRTRRMVLSPEQVPQSLRPSDQEPLLEEDDVGASPRAPGSRRGGFTHAPSINHAAAAALLRNAYLSHASSEQAEVLSNNLSSDRVRRANFILEGMRNGQPIEALLGYQFERAMHDRTSASAAGGGPVLELNEFIQPYRTAFPFESQEIAQAGTGPAAETIPPYSVVNGLKLTEATLDSSNGFGLQAALAPGELPGPAQGTAILEIRAGLIETIDAVKDLLMAENAYQLVQGNFDRVAAVSLAQKDARIPPALEVINTPRGSQFTFTNRVTLHFDDVDAAAADASPWAGIAMTPRASAEPGLNRWLGRLMGPGPANIVCRVRHVGKDGAGKEIDLGEAPVSVADLGLQPVDVMALVGINDAQSQGGATELESRIAAQYRSAQGLPDVTPVRIDFDVGSPAATTFAQLFPLARRLRSLLGECRPLGAQDFLPAAGGKPSGVAVDKANPGGHDVAELRRRVQTVRASLQTLHDRISGAAAPPVDLVIQGEAFSGQLGLAYAKLEAAGVDFADTTRVQTTFGALAAQALWNSLTTLALYGVADAFTPETDPTTEAARVSLLSRARRVARRLRSTADPKDGILDRADVSIAAATPDKPLTEQLTGLLQAGQALFSDTLIVLPQFTCHNEIDLAASAAARADLLSHALSKNPGLDGDSLVDEWLQGVRGCARASTPGT